MANILDIFRTKTGERIVKKTGELTGLKEESIEQALIYTFPTLLICYEQKNSTNIQKPEKLIEFIETGDLLQLGKKEIDHLLMQEELEVISNFSGILKIDYNKFVKILYISGSVLATIISEISLKNNSSLYEILKSLSGRDSVFDADFLDCLIKNSNDPNLIGSKEEMLLGKKKSDDDPSILGGYTGGR